MVTTPKKRISKKKKIALVLSGGGTKAAAFHIGVGYALKEAGFEFYQGLKSDQNTAPPGERAIQTYEEIATAWPDSPQAPESKKKADALAPAR